MTQTNLLVRGWEVVIGFETHAQLLTKTKIFSGAPNAFGAEPNTQASYVDLALPGTLPVMNKQAVECAIIFGLAIGAKVAPVSIFARKNYFYPDLPHGYQISQFEHPVVIGGSLTFMVGETEKTVHLTRAHLEEDAGKSVHDEFPGYTAIDLNRAGTPLLEIVTEPDICSTAEAIEYARTLHRLVTWLGICDGNMQEGSFRCDANVSIRRPGAALGTRREIKNLNSFNNMELAINAEINYQIETLEDGGSIKQATVLFDPDTGETRAMRSKEDAADYRYFPNPDLPPLVIAADWIERVRKTMPELPAQMAERLIKEHGLSVYDANIMTQSRAFADFFEQTTQLCKQPKLAANWLMGEVSRLLNNEELTIEQAPITPQTLSALILRIADSTISHNAARKVFEELWSNKGGEVDAIIEAKGLKQMSDTGAIEKIVDDVIAANAKNVEEYRAGKDKAFNALVGQIMKATQGRANPGQVSELLKKKLDA
ncbi:MAG: Asp-tRNA(Asn)/Glu-tRNA(Gln) amidotransferase subunit GatB [Saezia sp.]